MRGASKVFALLGAALTAGREVLIGAHVGGELDDLDSDHLIGLGRVDGQIYPLVDDDINKNGRFYAYFAWRQQTAPTIPIRNIQTNAGIAQMMRRPTVRRLRPSSAGRTT